MKLPFKLILLTLTISLFNCTPEKAKMLEIDGTVLDPDIKSILLVKPNQDLRFDSILEIPVINGRFNYKAKLEYPEAVTLMLGKAKQNGGGSFMPLFLENDAIKLTINKEEEFKNNTVEGGLFNSAYQSYKKNMEAKFFDELLPIQDSLNALWKSGEYHSKEMKVIMDQLKEEENQDELIVLYQAMDDLREKGLDKSAKGQELSDQRASIHEKVKAFQQSYIEANPNLVSYHFLLDDLRFQKETIDIEMAEKNYELLAQANPDHPYNEIVLNMINAIKNIKIGKPFIDFSAPDLKGNMITLSNQINGKIALLDLWATWCGPCISKTRTMLPLYEEYKDKGFTILGVAGEFKNTNRLIKFLEKEKWPWLNLVELDRENAIWQKYGVDGGGGGIFLIDEQGTILAKDPTAEEVKEVLENRLGNKDVI
ncbi:TlpA disulfide reductase family protein [Zhouia amylolytica]|uniref:TlpA disulfide reductase family protein n=1 Tax=Zhouia amylolytica TaxID=376730 RepID=UPI0020CC76E7|nr:TlpA disulfide reductase family protein [Zhouia amylolytica]MCQ0111705.1 AhpC/TSA family protein [Zhouia amylolytica]